MGGSLSLEVGLVSDSDVMLPPGLQSGEYVRIRASDSGTGMEPEVAEHAFEPFFTTKSGKDASGLGLATVYQIVSQSGGAVTIDSELGRGTAITILLPKSTSGVTKPASRPGGGPGTGSETVLVVEDEAAVRAVVCRTLKGRGYEVLEASSGADAITVERAHDGPIHLLVTDVVMPGMNGPALAERLRISRPEMGVLFMSGYTGEEVLHQGISDSAPDFLGKPFRAEQLVRRVRGILDRPRGGPSRGVR